MSLIQEDAEEGLLFMQEMIELSTQNQPVDSPPKQVLIVESVDFQISHCVIINLLLKA